MGPGHVHKTDEFLISLFCHLWYPSVSIPRCLWKIHKVSMCNNFPHFEKFVPKGLSLAIYLKVPYMNQLKVEWNQGIIIIFSLLPKLICETQLGQMQHLADRRCIGCIVQTMADCNPIALMIKYILASCHNDLFLRVLYHVRMFFSVLHEGIYM